MATNGLGHFDLVDVSELQEADPRTMPLADLRRLMVATDRNEQVVQRLQAFGDDTPEDDGSAESLRQRIKADEVKAGKDQLAEMNRAVIAQFDQENPNLTPEQGAVIGDYVRKHLYKEGGLLTTQMFRDALRRLKLEGIL